MRLRILSNPPLPPLKAWFADDSLKPSDTIFTLKTALCRRIRALQKAKVLAEDFCLTLNSFELLDEISISVIREDELLTLEAITDTRCKPIRQEEGPPFPFKRRRTSVSTRDSHSPSSASAFDAASSPNLPPALKSFESKIWPVVHVKASSLKTSFVPPGQGKTATHRRNLRRRLRKKYAAKSTLLGPSSLVDKQQVAHRSPSETFSCKSTVAEHTIVDPPSLRNHKSTNNVHGAVTHKIVFPDNFEDASPQDTLVDARFLDGVSAPSIRQKRGDLPSNIFVTCINTEDGVSTNVRKRSSPIVTESGNYTVSQGDETSSSRDRFVPSLYMQYLVDEQWDQLCKVTELSLLHAGMITGWKELGVNLDTLTPEIMIQIAQVCQIQDEVVTVLPLGILGSAKPNTLSDVTQLEEEEEEEEKAYTLKHILESDWRTLN